MNVGQASDYAWKTLGLYISPGMGKAIPATQASMREIIQGRMAGLKFLPDGWNTAVAGLIAQFPDDLVRVAPPFLLNGIRNPQTPDFLNTPEKLAVWQEIWQSSDAAIVKAAKGYQDDAAADLAALQADADFWNKAYTLYRKVADAVAEVGDKIAHPFSLIPTQWLILGGIAIALGVFYLYKRK